MWREIKRLIAKKSGKSLEKNTVAQYGPSGTASVLSVSRWSRVFLTVAFFTLSACANSQSATTTCASGLTPCENGCVPVSYDVLNCGSCGNRCAQPLGVCSNARCQATCDQGLKDCSGNCVPESTDCQATYISTGTGSAGTTTPSISGGAGISGSTTSTTANGGSSGSMTTGGGAGSGSVGTSAVPNGGYITSGDWHGFAWTAVQKGTITPEKFSAVTTFPLCASGSIQADTDYASVAMVGWNLKQANGANTAIETVTSKKAGITVTVTNKGTSELRAQLQGPNGATDAADRWCAKIQGSGGSIPFSKFNTKCWDDSGTAYSGQPIAAAMVLVPGLSAAAVSFDFCVDKIAESDN